MESKIDLGQISGKTRKRSHLLGFLEPKLMMNFYPLIPKFVETYHLTWSAAASGLGVLFFSFLAKDNVDWFWLVNLFIMIHHFTDFFDGEVGRRRETGLVKWGFYADHFMDFAFLSAVMAGYCLALPEYFLFFFLFFIIIAGHFFNSLLRCIALGEYSTSGHFGFGPAEITVAVVIFNFALIFLKTVRVDLAFGIASFLAAAALIDSFYQTQKACWKMDMEIKKAGQKL